MRCTTTTSSATFLALFALSLVSRDSAQSPLQSSRCSPERSETSAAACVWTGDCDRPGCADKCITNRGLTESWYVLLDRSIGEKFYSACPTLARWVNRALSDTRGTGRRLLSDHDTVEILRQWPAMQTGSKQNDGLRTRKPRYRRLLNSGDTYEYELVEDYDDYAYAPVPGTAPTSGIPSNACPTLADVEEAAESIVIFASLFRKVFEVAATGQPIPSDLEYIAYILEEPNTYQWLGTWLHDPDRVASYIMNECSTMTIETPQAYEYLYWLDSNDLDRLDTDLTMVQCVDNFGAYDQFDKNYYSAQLSCNPPFDLEPDCFTLLGHYIVTSPACATAYARMWNVTDPTPLASVAASVSAIQTACSAITNKDECLSASTPALETIEQHHNSIPILHELDLGSVGAIGPVSSVSPVFFGDSPQPISALPGELTGENTAQIDALRGAGIQVIAVAEPGGLQPVEAPPPISTISLPPNPDSSVDDTAAVAGGVAAAAVVALLVIAFIIYRIKQKRTANRDLSPRTQGAVLGAAGAADITRATSSSMLWLPTAGSTDASGRAITGGSKPAPPVPQKPGAQQGSMNLPFHGLPWPAPPSRPSQGGAPGSIGQRALYVTRRGLPGVTTAGEALSSLQSWATGRTVGFNTSELRVVPATTFTAGSNWSDYQRAATTTTSPLDALEVALDAMCSMQEPFYDRYMIRSSMQRRVGGQGLVQFASILNTEDKAAIKFYMDKSAFQRERDLYQDPQLNSMMPATLAIIENADDGCKTPYGYSFPPFVIIECGQSLDEWALANSKADFITIFQALSHSVRALQKLHSVGYAHRDIKPGNILRRYKEHDWTLIDFGCTAQIGTTANMAFTLKYAPPEVMHAMESGCRTIAVDSAVDMWAIGVIAYELLTRERAFPVDGLPVAEAEQKARDAIAGRTQLPWEVAAADGTDAQLAKMRFLRHTVLRCLDRDPAGRPSAAELLATWDHAFDDLQSPNRQR